MGTLVIQNVARFDARNLRDWSCKTVAAAMNFLLVVARYDLTDVKKILDVLRILISNDEARIN